ncbi:MAG: LptE family protein [Flavobacteriales bacterium]
MKNIFLISIVILLFNACGIYSFTGGQYSGAKTFSVDYLKPQTALATPAYAQRLTEALKDLLVAQSPLKLVESDGELSYSGLVTEYKISPIAIQGGAAEQASQNRLTISVKIKYNNALEENLNFEKTFSKFADYNASTDLFSIEEDLWKQINEQLVTEIFNASVGNW